MQEISARSVSFRTFIGVVGVVALVGTLVGRVTAPTGRPRIDVAAAPPSSATRAPAAAAPVRPMVTRCPPESRADLVSRLAARGGDPAEVLGVMIDAMRDDEIVGILSSLIEMSPEHLREFRDIRAFGLRVAELAMDDVLRPRLPWGANIAEVEFSTTVDGEAFATESNPSFGLEVRRIYAHFSVDDYREEAVFAKWYRVDEPEILSMGRYRVRPNSAVNHVWLESASGWGEGEYRVGFYSMDESMAPIAEGRFFVE